MYDFKGSVLEMFTILFEEVYFIGIWIKKTFDKFCPVSSISTSVAKKFFKYIFHFDYRKVF